MCTKMFSKLCLTAAVVLAWPLLVPQSAKATAYTWSGGGATKSWDLTTNWNPSTSVPNAYTDTATLTATTNWPATIGIGTTNTIVLGAASGNALSITGSGATTVALDIANGGTLGMKGTIADTMRITIEGTMSNDDTTSHTVSGAGGIVITNGTISSAGGGAWSIGLTGGVTGYGTISAPISITAANVSVNGSLQTLHITGDVTVTPQRGLGGQTNAPAGNGGTLSIEGGTITGATAGSSGITNYNAVNLRGTFNNITLYHDGSGAVNLTGNSSWNSSAAGAAALNTMSFNGYKLDVTGSMLNFGTVTVDTGTLNNPGATVATIKNGNTISLGGGSITNAGGGGLSFATNIRGFGTISSPLTITANGGMSAQGGTLAVTSPVTVTQGSGVGTSGGASDVLDLSSTFTSFGSFLAAGTSGTVNLDGATLVSTSTFVSSGLTFGAGAINVTNSSSMSGLFNSSATFTINSGQTLTVSAGTFNLNAGSFTNNGILAIGSNTLNASSAIAYTLGGAGTVTLAGGTISSINSTTPTLITGGGFTNNNTIQGYGIISEALNNLCTVSASGSGDTLSLTGPVTQLPGSTLTGGTWIANANSTLNIASAGNILANQGTVILNGAGSQFANIDSIDDNQGSFSVQGGRSFTTAGNLANSGTLLVDGGGTFSVTGDVTVTGDTTVGASSQMYADSIVQNTITLGAGATLTIRAISGGPTAGAAGISPVPEPSTLVMAIGALCGFVIVLCRKRHAAG